MALSETQHRTLMHVAQSEKFSGPGSSSNRGAVWMANQTGRGVRRVNATLDSLETLGLVVRDGDGPRLTEKGRTALAEGDDAVSFERDPPEVERELLAELEADRSDAETEGLLARLTGLFD